MGVTVCRPSSLNPFSDNVFHATTVHCEITSTSFCAEVSQPSTHLSRDAMVLMLLAAPIDDQSLPKPPKCSSA